MQYQGNAVAFLTQHGKELLLGPLFHERIGCTLVRATGFDTDRLGTFTRDIPRPDTQLATARLKARKGMELCGLSLGIGSEGAIGTDPVGGIIPWNTEMLVWLDARRGVEIVGLAQGPGGGVQRFVGSENELRQFAADAGFPSHGIVLRPEHENHPGIRKGLVSWPALLAGFQALVSDSPSGRVFAELDHRAHLNPTRQQMILRAAENLLARIASTCPACDAPGYWMKEHVAGLPCEECGAPTRLPIATIWRCELCGHSDVREEPPDRTADPSRCDYCNP
jgi:hypothetical protein